jgi:TNF receptor-associated factor 5
MHVRWLLRFRLQDNHRRLGAGPGSNGGSDGGGSSGDSPLPRRLSDGLSRDIITKL